MKYTTISADKRIGTGKGVARKLRASGMLPAICYSSKSTPIPLAINAAQFDKALKASKGGRELIQVNVQDAGGVQEKVTLIKEIQRDVVQHFPIHIDFWEVDMEKEMIVDISIRCTGTPVGVEAGGTLEQIRREVTVSCRPDNLVDSIEVDVSELNIGDAIHVMDLKLGKGLSVVADTNFTVATVVAPSKAEEVAEEEELEEGEAEESEEEAESS